MEDDYTGGDICIDGSTDCIGNDIVYGSRTDIHLKKAPIKREQSQACLSYVEREGVRQSQKASTEWSGLIRSISFTSGGSFSFAKIGSLTVNAYQGSCIHSCFRNFIFVVYKFTTNYHCRTYRNFIAFS